MKTKIFFFVFFTISIVGYTQPMKDPFHGNETPTYHDLIQEYQQIDSQSEYAKLIEFGISDVGKPLHLLIIDKDGNFEANSETTQSKTIVLINNGIHPGESCGIDASILLANEILDEQSKLHKLLEDVIVLIIPAYNIGGMLNRNSYSRANQNGPAEYGFRGNAKNLDLNRDFIKCNSKNAASFSKMYNHWNPDVYAETHTTNGSDHQYTLTLISSQKDKLAKPIATFQEETLVPQLYELMAKEGKEMIPYVYSLNGNPKEGIKAFLETPRYSTGYTALHHSFGFITEAHVFKPYEDRVNHTLAFLKILLQESATYKSEIKEARKASIIESQASNTQVVNWELDSNTFKLISFKGYEKVEETSEVTGNRMHFYDSDKPYETQIKFFDTYKPSTIVNKAAYYIVPQAYTAVIERLKWNGVKMQQLKQDSLIYMSYYRIKNYQTLKQAYEGHYLHYNTEVILEKDSIPCFQGDYLIPVNQAKSNYITHVLEPQSVDGFFNWNFFDGILQQKEWFSDYAFEPKAKAFLEQNPDVKAKFEEAKAKDSLLRKNNFEQLYFIYKLSPYYELGVNRFPVYRIENKPNQ
tara:strand:+ start:6214 stop:7956 length:1743 start_codon:yes stop_codon:yes gene_type:complete